MAREAFEELVDQALAEVPERFRKLMDNVVILVEDNARPEHGQEIGIRKNEGVSFALRPNG